MDINHLISQYGYAALIVGSMAEGETDYPAGRRRGASGATEISLVVIAVALGGMIGDQLLYLVGRRFGDASCAVSPVRKRGSVKRSV